MGICQEYFCFEHPVLCILFMRFTLTARSALYDRPRRDVVGWLVVRLVGHVRELWLNGAS